MKVKYLYVVISVVCMVGFSSTVFAEWNHGIGTGLSRQNIEGDIGVDVAVGGLGPVEIEVDLDPDDFSDLTQSAFGFGGYATDGTWMVQYALVNYELEGENSQIVGASTVSSKVVFEKSGAEVTLGRHIIKRPHFVLGVLGGARYTKHEWSSTLTVGGSTQSRELDNNWTDALVGLTLAVPFLEKWTWNTRVDAGFGGSEGTSTVATNVTWKFLENWSASINAKRQSIEFEEGTRGDADWYLYDTDETSFGASFLYHW